MLANMELINNKNVSINQNMGNSQSKYFRWDFIPLGNSVVLGIVP
jgi:hypothetical protein